ncbi:MAG: methyltransferase domain-containing protein [Pseudomonadota bacterium]
MTGLAEAFAGEVTATEFASNLTQYERYFASGSYDHRYPCPNQRMLRLAESLLPPDGHFIDFGCGSGRYLLNLSGKARIAAGYDICEAALERLRAALAERSNRLPVTLLGPDPSDLDRHASRHGPADLVLCLFGVLSHIRGRAARRRVLEQLRSQLMPRTGRLLISVPNRFRRFTREQKAAGAGAEEIHYTRGLNDGSVEMSYRLFDPESLQEELAQAGLEIVSLGAESLLSESTVTRSRLLQAADGKLSAWLPAAWGYGITAVARRAGETD